MARIFSFQHLYSEKNVDGGYALTEDMLPDGTWVVKDIWTHTEHDSLNGTIRTTDVSIIPTQNTVSMYLLEQRAWESGTTTIQQRRYLFASPQPFAIIRPLGSAPHQLTNKCLVIEETFDILKKRAIFSCQIDDGLAWREYSPLNPRTLHVANKISTIRNGRYYRLTDLQPDIGTYAADIWDIYEPFYDGGQILVAKDEKEACYGEALVLAKGAAINPARHALEQHCQCVLHRIFGENLLNSIWIPQKWAETILCLNSLGYVKNS
ncbi:MAG: hypothetical protein Q7R79_04645 [bacterium]|nr:hypothetical protein [bacterium]